MNHSGARACTNCGSPMRNASKSNSQQSVGLLGPKMVTFLSVLGTILVLWLVTLVIEYIFNIPIQYMLRRLFANISGYYSSVDLF